MRATHTITINQDESCENSPNENFFSNIALTSGQPPIFVTRPRVRVIIDDSPQPECSKQYIIGIINCLENYSKLLKYSQGTDIPIHYSLYQPPNDLPITSPGPILT